MATTTAIAGGLLAVMLSGALAADWPNWRGPDHNGVSSEKGLDRNVAKCCHC